MILNPLFYKKKLHNLIEDVESYIVHCTELFSKAAFDQADQAFNSLLLIAAVRNDADRCTAYDAE